MYHMEVTWQSVFMESPCVMVSIKSLKTKENYRFSEKGTPVKDPDKKYQLLRVKILICNSKKKKNKVKEDSKNWDKIMSYQHGS